MRAFYFYIDDWLSSKQIEKMDAHEECGYLHLILAAASEDGAPSLPDDDEELAILSKLGAQWWKPTKERAKRIGEKTSGKKLREAWRFKPPSAFSGRIYNERIYREWVKQQAAHRAQSEGGKRGNRKRWATSNPDRVPMPDGSGSDRVAMFGGSVPVSPPSHSIIAPTVEVRGLSFSSSLREIRVCGKSLSEWSERWYFRHPKQRHQGLVEEAIYQIHTDWLPRSSRAKVQTEDELFGFIDTRHLEACNSPDWKKHGGKFAPKLHEYLGDETYLQRADPDDDEDSDEQRYTDLM